MRKPEKGRGCRAGRCGLNVMPGAIRSQTHRPNFRNIPQKIAASSYMGYLEGKCSLMMYEEFRSLKHKYRGWEC